MKRIKKVIGVTGGVGAGKSTVLSYMKEEFQAQIIECDQVGRELEMPGGICYQPILALFGQDLPASEQTEKAAYMGGEGQQGTAPVLNPDGTFNRPEIARRIFTDPDLRKKLNDIVHPAVMAEAERRIQEAEGDPKIRFSVIESAVLYEVHGEDLCDEVWYIDTDPQVRRERLKASRGYTDAKIDSIFRVQKSPEYFRSRAQFVVDNSSEDVNNTYKQIREGLIAHGIL